MTTPPRVVLLAAGASERLGQPKALVKLAGRTALEHLLDACGDPNPLLITGAHASELTAAIRGEGAGPRAELLHHPTWSNGRSSSIACGETVWPSRSRNETHASAGASAVVRPPTGK